MTPRALMITLVALGLSAVVVLGLSIWIEATSAERARAHCRAVGAEPVHTGHEHYICVRSDGKVVA